MCYIQGRGEKDKKNWISKLINIEFRDEEIKKQVNDEKMHSIRGTLMMNGFFKNIFEFIKILISFVSQSLG